MLQVANNVVGAFHSIANQTPPLVRSARLILWAYRLASYMLSFHGTQDRGHAAGEAAEATKNAASEHMAAGKQGLRSRRKGPD